jgi:hypothetical protein
MFSQGVLTVSRVLILVEGPTERAIVEHVFAPVLGGKGVFLFPRVVGKPGHKGGNKFAAVRRELKALYFQEPNSIVAMLFDYYGLPDDWPGLTKAKGKSPYDIPSLIEPAIAEAVALDIGRTFSPKRFIPYIQLHEIESLLFAGPGEMARVFQQPGPEIRFAGIVHECGGCELINDNPVTAPSKRIQPAVPSLQ